MKIATKLALAALFVGAAASSHATTYSGNGLTIGTNGAFTGAVGGGSLTLTDDGTNVFGTFTKGPETASLGSPGVDSIKWLKPVRPGDTLRVRTTVLDARPLESKPHIGLVHSQWQMYNQIDECVMEMQGHGMLRRRPPD